jgi:translocation and assembly module TamB
MIRKDQYAIIASGFVPFSLTSETNKRVKKDPINVTISIEEGTLNLLSSMSPYIKSASGPLRAQMHITGTLNQPITNGYCRITGGEVYSKRYFTKLTGLNIDCVWKYNLLTIREFSGKIGEGRMRLSGNIVFEKFAPQKYDLTWQSLDKKGIAISIPELPIPSPLIKTEEWEIFSNLSHGEPKFEIKLQGSAANPLLSGWVELENSHFTYPSILKKGEGEDPLENFWSKLSWDLELRSGKNSWYDNELVSVNIQGGIKLTGKGSAPRASGRIEAVRGNISYLGSEFKIKQAALEIIKDNCFLEAEAETEVFGTTSSLGENDTIQMYIDKADISRIKPRFISKNTPDLAQEKALARATGIDPEMYSATDQEYLLRQQLIRIFDSTLTTPLARSLLRKSGIVDTFRVQYHTQEPIKPVNPANPTLLELLHGTKYSLEKNLSDRMLFGYSVTFDQMQNKLDLRHELELSYRLQKNVFLKGSYELDTNNPFRQYDRRITVEQQFRFGFSPRKKKP